MNSEGHIKYFESAEAARAAGYNTPLTPEEARGFGQMTLSQLLRNEADGRVGMAPQDIRAFPHTPERIEEESLKDTHRAMFDQGYLPAVGTSGHTMMGRRQSNDSRGSTFTPSIKSSRSFKRRK